MKTNIFILGLLAFGMTFGSARLTSAQIFAGLPVLDTAGTRDPGNFEFTPGAALGQDMNFYGVRGGVTLLDELRGFIDLGRLDVDRMGDNLALQGGLLYSLPVTEYFDTAVRGAGYYCNTDRIDIRGGNLMLVFSDETLLDGLFAYSGLGVDYSERETYKNVSEVNPAVAIGLAFRITDHFWALVEGDYIDDFYCSAALSLR